MSLAVTYERKLILVLRARPSLIVVLLSKEGFVVSPRWSNGDAPVLGNGVFGAFGESPGRDICMWSSRAAFSIWAFAVFTKLSMRSSYSISFVYIS